MSSNSTETESHIILSNNTAGRQLLNSIAKNHSSIHSLLETENTNAVTVFQILIELFQQVDINVSMSSIKIKTNVVNLTDLQEKMMSLPRKLHVLCARLKSISRITMQKTNASGINEIIMVISSTTQMV